MADARRDETTSVDDLELRPERDADEPFLRALYAAARADELAHTGWTAEQADAFLRMQFDLQRAHYRRHYAGASFLVVERDGRPIGRLYVHYAPEDVRVLDIALMPDARGNGVGRRLLEHVLAEADRLGAPVTLHVAPDSPARRLYERLGFRTLTEDALNLFMERLPSPDRSRPDHGRI